MRLQLLTLSLFISYASLGQNDRIRNFVSETFFGYNITVKPEKIESGTIRPIDYGESYDEKNIIKFDSHPFTKSKVNGEYNVKYLYYESLFKDFGIYQLDMTIRFANYKSAKEMLEKLKKMCRENAVFKDEIVLRGSDPKSEDCTYDFDEKLQLPRIILNYYRAPHTVRIRVYTTCDFNKFKNHKNKLW